MSAARWLPRLLLGTLALPATAQDPAAAAACRVCHPAAAKALAGTPHQALLVAGGVGCAGCHGDVPAAAAGGHATAVPKVAAATCRACHPDEDRPTASAAHPLVVTGSGAPPPPPDPALHTTLQAATRLDGAEWSGLVELGYRLLHRQGSRAAYRSDVDLDPGLRLRTFELHGRGLGSLADEADLHLADLGDPHASAGAAVRQADRAELRSDYRHERWRYRADGDYHRVDRDVDLWHDTAEVALQPDLRLSVDHTRSDDDGFWLTQRIGERSLGAAEFVDGVPSPRHSRTDTGEVGLQGTGRALQWSLAVGYLEQHDRAAFAYAQPATADPTFLASEDFGSRQGLSGPHQRLHLGRQGDRWDVTFDAAHYDRRRHLAAQGTGTGYDIAPYDTRTDALGHGHARTWLLDAGIGWDLLPELRLGGDLHWRDHQERLLLAQTDVTVWPTLATTSTVDTDQDARTVQRLGEGSATCEWTPVPAFGLLLGHGFAREQLRVPAPGVADPRDFRAGHTRDQGVLAGLRWQPGDTTLRLDWRDFGQDGAPLHELAPERSRSLRGSLGWAAAGRRAELHGSHRRNDNAVSRHHLEAVTAGVLAGTQCGSWTASAGYDYARSSSRTLTSFYFDPDPDPVPTFVGFHGAAHTFTGTLGGELLPDLRLDASGACTRTSGSLPLRTFDWQLALHWRCTARGTAGLELRQLDYRDAAAGGDQQAVLLFVGWQQVF